MVEIINVSAVECVFPITISTSVFCTISFKTLFALLQLSDDMGHLGDLSLDLIQSKEKAPVMC